MKNSELKIRVPEQAKNLSDDRLFVDFLDFVLQNKQNLKLLRNMLRPYQGPDVHAIENPEILDFSYNPYSATGTLLFKHGGRVGSEKEIKNDCVSINFEIDNKLGVFRMIFPKPGTQAEINDHCE